MVRFGEGGTLLVNRPGGLIQEILLSSTQMTAALLAVGYNDNGDSPQALIYPDSITEMVIIPPLLNIYEGKYGDVSENN